MLCKRIIPCLDVDNGTTVKGVQFQNLRKIGDPVALALRYQAEGADELAFLDISATVEGRTTMLEVVEKVADKLSIPFTVGGGIRSLADADALLKSGADKVTINTAAVNSPGLIGQIADKHGSQCCVLAIDAKRSGGNWQVVTHGGRIETGIDALEWGSRACGRGAGEILLTSWDKDGSRSGFDLDLTSLFATELPVPVIASGGAADMRSFVDVFAVGKADAALAASVFHDDDFTISALKKHLTEQGVEVRP